MDACSESLPEAEQNLVLGSVMNLGEPLRVADVGSPDSFLITAVPPGGGVASVAIKGALTSDEPLFHRFIEGLEQVVARIVQLAGAEFSLKRAATSLLVFKASGAAEFWFDTAAVSLQCLVKRPVEVATAIFENDIADITAMNFPCVTFEPDDKVLCLFREGWGFGLAFDFNPERNFDRGAFTRSLGTLVRTLRYRHLYGAMRSPETFDGLLAAGWFPFAEIINAEFKELASYVEEGFDMSDVESRLVDAFNERRLSHMLLRWSQKPHLAVRAGMLEEAINAFKAKAPASVIKIILTEIEGVLNDAHRAATGSGAKLKDLLEFALASAEKRAGSSDTLLFPLEFGKYLARHTFASFDPIAQTGTAGSRHAVGHGAAAQHTYTMPRALQAMLTLDQLAFYT